MGRKLIPAGPMIASRFVLGENVESIGGWFGVVERVRKFPSGTQYRVRWNRTSQSSWISACNLRKVDKTKESATL